MAAARDPRTHAARTRARLAAVTVGTLLVGLAGYGGFVAFTGGDRAATAGVWALAAGTGFAAFFSPCSFPLLLTHLARRAEETPGRAIVAASRMAIGALLLFALLAGALAVAGSAIGGAVSFDTTLGRALRLVVAVALAIIGLRHSGLWRRPFRWTGRLASRAAAAIDRTRRLEPGAGRDLAHGFGYLLAGFG